MKKMFYIVFSLLFISNLYSQNKWNFVWKLDQMPNQNPEVSSEMAIVKAGFDTDEDGWGEFICAYTDLAENYIMMYEANADNSYDLVWSWKYPLEANSFAGIAVGDIDNNGVVDIITTMPTIGADPSPPRLWVFQWNGVQGENKYGDYTTGEPEPINSWDFNIPAGQDFRPYSLSIEDIDNDGKNELVAGARTGDNGGEVVVAFFDGDLEGFGAWQIEYNLQGLKGGSTYNVTTGDLDKDGNKEIYAFVWNLFTMYIIECTGDSQYEVVDSLKTVYETQNIDYGALDAVRVADVNNDGTNELYIAGTEPENTIFVITNISDVSKITAGDVKELYHIPVKYNGKLRAMQIADPDGDGKMDLMIAGEQNGQIFDLEYKGSGDPADSANWELNVAFDIFDFANKVPFDSGSIDPRLFYGSPANDMDKDGKNEYVFVNYRTTFPNWSDDAYVWVIESDQATGIQELSPIPTGFSLAQNYPNPFNPSTNITFNLDKSGKTKIVVSDVLGRIVETLVDREMSAGEHQVRFNADGYSAGVYYYTLYTGDNSQTKKMILLK